MFKAPALPQKLFRGLLNKDERPAKKKWCINNRGLVVFVLDQYQMSLSLIPDSGQDVAWPENWGKEEKLCFTWGAGCIIIVVFLVRNYLHYHSCVLIEDLAALS